VYGENGAQKLVFPKGKAANGNAYGEFDTTVSANSFYVVGDNTAPGASSDSDQWGLVPRADIVGVVVRRVSPDSRVF
jgi:Signal peptidase, peptidase S26